MSSLSVPFLVAVLLSGITAALRSSLSPSHINVFLNQTTNFTLTTTVPIQNDIVIHFKKQSYVNFLAPLTLQAESRAGQLQVIGERPVSELVLTVARCVDVEQNSTDCNAVVQDLFLKATVLRSPVVASLVILVGWAYFLAWSVSFYPQIFLNIRRQSVVGLNFDFLLLNIIGFVAYSAYNVLMYFDANVQRQYEDAHPHSPIPVLLNDVFFAVHALIACLFTAAQCFFYEHGNQRISFTCLIISGIMVVAALGGGVITVLGFINMLHFITSLSYIKMIVTLLKYIPQAMQNFRRKSTIGWSIGNVLLDFTGGCFDIIQMCLQCWNVADWSAFYGNPVKFGLGLVSIFFDVLFIMQHYVLYRNSDHFLKSGKSNQTPMATSETDGLEESEEDSSAKANKSKGSNR